MMTAEDLSKALMDELVAKANGHPMSRAVQDATTAYAGATAALLLAMARSSQNIMSLHLVRDLEIAARDALRAGEAMRGALAQFVLENTPAQSLQ